MPRGRHVGICNVVGLSGLVGAPQVTRSAATPVGNALSSEIHEKLRDFTGLARGARDSVTKLREIQANFSTTEARLSGAEARLCGVEARVCGAEAKLCGAQRSVGHSRGSVANRKGEVERSQNEVVRV